MKIGLIADTQGNFDVSALLYHVAREFAGVDEIWHAGDWGSEEVLEGLRRLGRLVVVNGNALGGRLRRRDPRPHASLAR